MSEDEVLYLDTLQLIKTLQNLEFMYISKENLVLKNVYNQWQNFFGKVSFQDRIIKKDVYKIAIAHNIEFVFHKNFPFPHNYCGERGLWTIRFPV